MTGRTDPESTAHRRAETGSQATAAGRSADHEEAADDDATALAEPADTVVAVEGLGKRFGSGPDATVAVDDVSLSIDRGAIVGLLGPNGAGKTTLVKSILGMVLPDEGSVHIDGIDARERPRAAYSRVDALLEGARNDYWRLTVRENLRYFATVSGVDPDSVQARHDRLLERLDLAAHADVAVRDLSRGMKQKVSLASVLAGGADVVFLDEPTLGLDVESARTLQTELRRLAADEGLTVVLSSHNMDVVETVCDRVVIMSEGRVIADDTVEALLGGSDTHEIHVTSADFDDGLLATLRERFALAVVDRRDRGAHVAATVDSDGLYDLMATLRAHDVTLDRVRTVEPDLEDVFVDITGSGERR
ncbi:ABC transporter ATP-binding protein [Halosimplex litoreum]|uniref:ABC transporter ATP-binding protein n=1 Tax=Halosimplex litoreum TaxID=1198301 RepID=A0A7T3FVW0_9EURY|nr:ABC transporter ATP-binding protein [Halosimplex litoreum]QPV61690.1 ABC transporter ATP-binding protein [Halosimplex litoreum]